MNYSAFDFRKLVFIAAVAFAQSACEKEQSRIGDESIQARPERVADEVETDVPRENCFLTRDRVLLRCRIDFDDLKDPALGMGIFYAEIFGVISKQDDVYYLKENLDENAGDAMIEISQESCMTGLSDEGCDALVGREVTVVGLYYSSLRVKNVKPKKNVPGRILVMHYMNGRVDDLRVEDH